MDTPVRWGTRLSEWAEKCLLDKHQSSQRTLPMTRRRPVALLSVIVLLLAVVCPGHAQPREGNASARQAAHKAAQEWLRHVDTGAWSSAWEAAAPALRDSVAEEQWATQGARLRETLGALRSRRLARAQRRDTLQRAADAGPLFLLRYHSTFEDGLYVETLLLAPDGDTWTVAGYEVAPVAVPAKGSRPSFLP